MDLIRNFVVFLLFSTGTINGFSAEMSEHGLSNDLIEEIRTSFKPGSTERGIRNALAGNSIYDIAVNRDFIVEHNNHFSHIIETKGITDQERSGRCWLFAGLNMLRPYVIKKYELSDFEFSQSYLFFWSKMEKANFFLERMIDKADADLTDREVELLIEHPVSEGGLWSYVTSLIDKYGAVPQGIMPDTYSCKHPWDLNRFISSILREYAIRIREKTGEGVHQAEIQKMRIEALKSVYRILVLNLGEPPEEFKWRYENKEGKVSEPVEYTPVDFYEEVIDFDIGEYIAIMNYPGKKYMRLFQFDNSRIVYDSPDPQYINLEMEWLEELTVKSVLKNEPVWFACDIIQDRYSDKGILSDRIIDLQSVYNVGTELDKEERVKLRESTANHAMVFTGVDMRNGEPVKWLVEDSHGSERGHNGHWTMYEDWFDNNLYIVIINKKFIPEKIIKILKQKPMHLPPWDPYVRLLKNVK